MLETRYIRENEKVVLDRLKIRGLNVSDMLQRLIQEDESSRKTKMKLDESLTRLNELNKEIAVLYANKKEIEAKRLKKESTVIKSEIKRLQEEHIFYNKKVNEILIDLPNIPHNSVPSGDNNSNNKIVKDVGSIPKLQKGAKPHWELIVDYNLVNFELGNKITGKGFPVYVDRGARLQRALISYFLDKNIDAGYIEYLPPHLVNHSSAFCTGQLPKFEEELFKIPLDRDLFLIPTAEVPITNLFRDSIIEEKDLPIRCTAYTPCFRREAGSYGKDVRGLNRLHQFDKVEIVQIEHPDKSYQTLESMVNHVAVMLDELELPYRIVQLCGGDLSFTSALTYDFEVYSAGQEKWLEVSSVSNFESYQSNRLKLRYKDSKGKKKLCHTLNGSALALPRIFSAIIENNQHVDNKHIKVPKILHKYLDFQFID